jgi:hypothetical protein
MTTPPPPALDAAAIGKLVREEVELKDKYFEFAQAQMEKDRGFFKHLYTYTAAFLLILVAFATFISFNSINQMRTEMKASLDAELAVLRAQAAAASSEAKATVNGELATVRTEVQKRIDTEFRSDNISRLIASAAKERTDIELAGIIRSETATQVAKGIQDQSPAIQKSVEGQTRDAVQALQPTIAGIINGELETQVKKSVAPVEAQMKAYAETITTERLSALAKSGDRKAFDQLIEIGFKEPAGSAEETKMLAQATVKDIIRQKNSPLHRMQVNFKVSQSPEDMKSLLKRSTIMEERLASLDNFPKDDISILPILIELIKNDVDLEVVWTAFRKFNDITKQSFEFPNYDQVFSWWTTNHAAFDEKPISK